MEQILLSAKMFKIMAEAYERTRPAMARTRHHGRASRKARFANQVAKARELHSSKEREFWPFQLIC